MKLNLFFGTLVAMAVCMLMACEEEPPYINYEPEYASSETTYVDVNNLPAAQKRGVLIEDISGVRCVNCPDASTIIKDIKSRHLPNDTVNAITIYPKIASLNSLTLPVNKPDKNAVSKYDLRTEAGEQLLSALGTPNSLPNGYVNRKQFNGALYRYIDRNDWDTKVNEEQDSTTPVNIWVSAKPKGTTELEVKLRLTFTQDLTGDYNISLALLQDSIVDVQESTDPNVGAIYIIDYVHNHVLRKMITATLGDRINTGAITLVRGRVVERTYTVSLVNPENSPNLPPFPPYDINHLHVMGFVQRAADNVVVHSKEFKVK